MRAVTLSGLFRILSDPIRSRTLGLLTREELAVGELARILGLQISRLSNHLRILREADLVIDRREGTWTFVRLARANLPPDLWPSLELELRRSPDSEQDFQRLEEVLEERRVRSRSHFERAPKEPESQVGDFLRGSARFQVLSKLVAKSLVVADVGTGDGYLSSPLKDVVGHLILVDHAKARQEQAKKRMKGASASVEFRVGELDELPMKAGEVDAVIAGLVVHHAPDITAFLREAFRVLKPNGVIIVEDLLPHREAWMRDSMADLRLGIEPRDLEARMRDVGFKEIATETLEDSYTPDRPDGEGIELPLFLTRATKRE
jgi:ArsR family transcriptional regulator